ncbi:MAG: glycosyl hydrolase 53 family protein [Bacteroidales bacterium]
MRNKYAVIIGLMVALGMVACCNRIPIPPDVIQPEWIVGGDLSLLDCNLAAGAVYKDSNGKDIEVMSFFKEKGMNYARIRLFVNPDLQSAACQNLSYVQEAILRAKAKGYHILLDFHYSDTWADPGKQFKPAAWEKLNSADLANRMYTYTRDVLVTLVKHGAAPDMIQIGNEVSNGFLWDSARVSVWDGEWNTQGRWLYFCKLLSQASRACREVCPQAWIMIHSDRGGDRDAAVRFFRHMEQGKVDYDIIGLSYYPFWHGPLEQLKSCLTALQMAFPDKPVNIVEVAHAHHPWGIPHDAGHLTQHPATPEGQKQFMEDFLAVIKEFPRVNGYMYWYPEETYVPQGPVLALHRGVFDNQTGKALPITDVLGN